MTEVDKEGPHEGGTLTMALTGVDTLDPARANEASTGQRVVLDMLYDGLVRWDSTANALTPALAKAWNVSDDGLTWTFDLTTNAQFSNGRAITSADVKFSLERLAARGPAALSAVQLAGLKGYADFMARRAESIAGLVATDPGKIAIVLDSPFSSLPELLASPAFGVVAKETYDATGAIVGYPIASGPFTLSSRTADTLVFVRAPRSRALLAGVKVVLAADTGASYALFTKGDVRLAATAPDQVLEVAVANLRSNNGASFFYGMNVTSPALANAALRTAIVKAIDREALRAKYFAQSGELANGLIPPGFDGYRDDACGVACTFDVAAAKQMVTTALAGAAGADDPCRLLHRPGRARGGHCKGRCAVVGGDRPAGRAARPHVRRVRRIRGERCRRTVPLRMGGHLPVARCVPDAVDRIGDRRQRLWREGRNQRPADCERAQRG